MLDRQINQMQCRALVAYFGCKSQQPRTVLATATEETKNGLDYVVVRDNGLTSVYRVRTANGKPMLKKMKRHPFGGSALEVSNV